MVITTAILIAALASLAAGGITAGVSAYNNAQNVKAQQQANQQNVQMQQAANEQQQYNLEHAHQIEMADLQAAGLNPILTATGGNGASVSSINAPSVRPVQSDVSGVNSAVQGIASSIQSMMMMYMMMDMKASVSKEITQMRNDVLLQNANSRNEVLSRLYQRKAEAYGYTNSASTISRASDPKAVKDALKTLEDIGYKLKKGENPYEALMKILKTRWVD